MAWVYNDGGRSEAGFRGEADDCVVRAIAIATRKPYKEVYEALNELAKAEPRRERSSSRLGVFRKTYDRYLLDLGWSWTPTMRVGSGCKVHLRADELPPGVVICSVSKHLVTVIDGIAQDTHDPTRDGTRCVYGYFMPPKSRVIEVEGDSK